MFYSALLLWLVAFACGAPMLIWAIECAAGLFLPARKSAQTKGRRPTVTVLVPAHNEAAGIRRTLESISGQSEPGHAIVVVADNCTDATAAIARQCGATVLERCDPARRGKSYALEYGLAALSEKPSEVVVVIDADCTPLPDAICRLAQLAFDTGRPVQGSYYLEASAGAAPGQKITLLAFYIKNVVRPRGLDRMGFSCFLNGSGMAFPASMVQSLNWANGRIAEDKWMTVDMALAGHLPAFCEESRISSPLPKNTRALSTQRTRWIHGHLESMLLQGPRLVRGAILQRRPELLALALELLVPPFSLLIVIWLMGMFITVIGGGLGGGWIPTGFLSLCGLLVAVIFLTVEWRFGKREFWGLLVEAPRYMLARVGTLATFLSGRQKQWVPTERDSAEPENAAVESQDAEDNAR